MPPSGAPHSSGEHWLDFSVSQDTRLRSPATLHTIGTPARVRASVSVQRRSRLRVWLPPQTLPVGGRLSTFVDGWNGIRNLHPKHHQSGVHSSFTTSLLLHTTSWETGLGSNSTHARAGNLDASKECTSFPHVYYFLSSETSHSKSTLRMHTFMYGSVQRARSTLLGLHEQRVSIQGISLLTTFQVLTCLGHTVVGYLHCQSISVLLYLDDW